MKLLSMYRSVIHQVAAGALAALLAGCGTATGSSSSVLYAPGISSDVHDRVRVADAKASRGDSSAAAEYRIARAMALVRIEAIELAIRDAMFLARIPPRSVLMGGSDYFSWKHAVMQFQLRLNADERRIIDERVMRVTPSERDRIHMRASGSAFVHEMSVSSLGGLVADWRSLRELVARIERSCTQCA